MKNNLIRNFKIMFNRSLKPYYIKNFYNFQILDKVKIYSLILSLAFRNSKTIMKNTKNRITIRGIWEPARAGRACRAPREIRRLSDALNSLYIDVSRRILK